METIRFSGAYMYEEEGKKEFSEKGPINIVPSHIVAYYDHVILTHTNKIRVMETYDEIKAKLEGK